MNLTIDTPKWAVPLLAHARYKGIWGGRSSGKSHFMAGMVVLAMAADPSLNVVCVREIQKSLALSAKKLIEGKIEQFGLGHLFEVQQTLIKRRGGKGLCIFQGLQDHTADSIKSLEGFNLAWVEEAQSLTESSLNLLRPTIRSDKGPFGAPASELWFTWNPRRRADAVEKLLRPRGKTRDNAIVVRANYTDNPFLPAIMLEEAETDRVNNPDAFDHVWLGGYESMGSKVVIPALWIESAIGLASKLNLPLTGKTYGALDVAGAEEGGDENAVCARKGIGVIGLDKWNGLDTSLTTQRAAKWFGRLDSLSNQYDVAGVGEGVTGEWASMGRRGEQPAGMTFTAWNGGFGVLEPDAHIDPRNPKSPKNKDHYGNLKAQAWFALRRRFEEAHKAATGKAYDPEMVISLPADLPYLEQLQDELAQPQQKTSGTGKIIVDKQPDGSASPNLADAVVMAFWPIQAKGGIMDVL
jgi:Phage terminase large subunit